MHIQNGNTASWWDFWYFVFIKILISVSLLLLFVFFVCLFEKQTILPAPAALWVWFCFTLIYFAQQFKLLVPDPANILLHVDLRAGRQARRAAGSFAGVSRALDPGVAKCILTQKKRPLLITPPAQRPISALFAPALKISAPLEFGGQAGKGTAKGQEQL